jgi:hypothetical protein
MSATDWDVAWAWGEVHVKQAEALGFQRTVQLWIDQCTCPACRVVWQHYWSKPWILTHFGSDAGPVTCPNCGVQSISGPVVGVRQRYHAPQVAVESRPRTFWQKVKALSEVPAPVIHNLTLPSEELPRVGGDLHARSRSSAQVSDSQADSPQL